MMLLGAVVRDTRKVSRGPIAIIKGENDEVPPIKIKKASVTSGKALNLVEEAELSEPEEVLSTDAEVSSDDANENTINLNPESADQSTEIPSEDSSKSEDMDEDSKEEK